MKIISKFKDYYDRALALGQDDRIPYVRLREEIPWGKVKILEDSLVGWDLRPLKKLPLKDHRVVSKITWSCGQLYICGKTYRYMEATTEYKQPSLLELTPEDTYDYFYTYEQFCKFVESYGFLVQDIYGEKMFGRRSEYAQIQAFLSAQGTDENEAELIKNRVVIARPVEVDSEPPTWRRRQRTKFSLEHNFPLREVQFYKLMDPYKIYQELDMYVCGVLGQQAKEVVKISDKDRIYQHGFDKYSFRKPPEE